MPSSILTPLLPALTVVLLGSALAVHAQQKPPPNLPDGPGKEGVQTYCSGCHGLNRVVASGYPQAYWHTVVRMMLNFGVAIPPDQINTITNYLAQHFPEKPKPVANIVPGPAQINIWNETEYGRTLRSQDAEIPDLGDPVRRLHRAQDGRYARRQSGARHQHRQRRGTGRGR
jgi:hypothetical protein